MSATTSVTDPVPESMPRQRLGWTLLVLWLLYSGALLGWNLAHDPYLATYICRTR